MRKKLKQCIISIILMLILFVCMFLYLLKMSTESMKSRAHANATEATLEIDDMSIDIDVPVEFKVLSCDFYSESGASLILQYENKRVSGLINTHLVTTETLAQFIYLAPGDTITLTYGGYDKSYGWQPLILDCKVKAGE